MHDSTNKKSTLLAALLLCPLLTACIATPKPETQPAITGEEFGNQLGAVEYVIQPGDNLVLIASEQTRVSENWRRIADFNRISNPATIKPGQTIWIPNDLIPLTQAENESRPVAGHPDAVVNSVTLPDSIKPVDRQ